MKKLLVLLCTASPGLQKLLLVAAGIYFWGTDDAGIYSKEFAIVYFISLFASLGYGASLLKEIPKTSETSQPELLRLALGASTVSAATIYIIACIASLAWPNIKILFSTYILFFTIACSAQQVTRHYFIAKQSYKALLGFDVVILIIQTAPIIYLPLDRYLQMVSIITITFTGAICLSISNGIKISKKSIFHYESFQFSVNNLVSGGVPAILPKIISLRYPGEVVAITTLYLSALSFLTTAARGYINYKIPQISLIIGNGQSFKKTLKKLRTQTQHIVILSILAGVIAYAPMDLLFNYVDAIKIYDIRLPTYLSILLFITSGAFGLADSAVLFLLGKQIHNIESNLIYFTLFLIACIAFTTFNTLQLEHLLLTLAILSAFRSVYVRFFCEKYLL